jgi:hypothetical protein
VWHNENVGRSAARQSDKVSDTLVSFAANQE